METAAKTWTGEWWKLGGGGTVWDCDRLRSRARPALHRHRQRLARGTAALRSPGGGDNLFLSLDRRARRRHRRVRLALPDDARRGAGTTPPRSTMILADLTIDGEPRKVLMQAPKNGFFYVLDRATGELISARARIVADQLGDRRRPGDRPADREPGGALRHDAGDGLAGRRAARTTGTRWRSARDRAGLHAGDRDLHGLRRRPRAYDPARGGLGTSFTGFDAERARDRRVRRRALAQGWLLGVGPGDAARGLARPGRAEGQRRRAGHRRQPRVPGHHRHDLRRLPRRHRREAVGDAGRSRCRSPAPITYEIDGEQYIAVNAGWGGGLAHVERSQLHRAVPVASRGCWCSSSAARRSCRRCRRLDAGARAEPAAAR